MLKPSLLLGLVLVLLVGCALGAYLFWWPHHQNTLLQQQLQQQQQQTKRLRGLVDTLENRPATLPQPYRSYSL